jgi:adenylate cyclase
MPEQVATFNDHLDREILASELRRIGILVRVLGTLIAFFGVMFTLFRDAYLLQFSSTTAAAAIEVILGLLLAYEFVVLRIMRRSRDAGRRISTGLRYRNALVETSVPSLLILAIAHETNPQLALGSALSLLYVLFIVLSTLRLDARLSAFTGLVAATEYLALGIVLGHGADVIGAKGFETTLPFYISKSAVLLLCGLAAGFVARQLNHQVGNAWRSQEERGRLLNAFGQQVSPAIVDELLRQGGGIASRRAKVCVLFMDIRNFTRLVEDKAPEEIVAFQNVVFSDAIHVVNRNHGIINQFLGDGLMATFGAPIPTDSDCANAIAAARDLVAGIRVLAGAGKIPPITIGVGLHFGDAVTGNIGSNERLQYSITGNVVIIASRIEQLNKEFGSQILVSREVLESAGGVGHEMGAEPLGFVQVKGREQPVEIFRLA